MDIYMKYLILRRKYTKLVAELEELLKLIDRDFYSEDIRSYLW